jgi:hypothetical protein
MNLGISTLVTLLALAVPAAVSAETWREQSEATEDARELKGVVVENPRGLVSVRRGATDQIHLTALKIVRGEDERHAARWGKETEVVTSREGGRYVVRVKYPQRQSVRIGLLDVFNGFELPRVEVRLEVEVPDDLPVRLASTSGDLESENVSGSQVLTTTSGDVTVQQARGPLRASSTSGAVSASAIGAAVIQTVSGDVEVERASGPLRITATSGAVSVKGARDSLVISSVSGALRVDEAPRGLRARTTSGDIVTHGAAGIVRINSTSGDVVLGLGPDARDVDVSTGSGDVDVSLDAGLQSTFEMRTSNGTVDVAAPLQVNTVSRHLVTAVIGRPSATVLLRTSSGDIHVRRGGD